MSTHGDVNVELGARQELLTHRVAAALAEIESTVDPVTAPIDDAEVPERLARHVGSLVARRLAGIRRPEARAQLIEQIVAILSDEDEGIEGEPTEVIGLVPSQALADTSWARRRPQTPLNDAALLTNAHGDPQLGEELRAEIPTADRIDLLCAFVKWHGLRFIEPELRAFHERGGRLRVITTTYIGATERRALDRLVQELGAEVKIQYDIERTRLHAKSWYFGRNSGWDTAYVGSSNLSKAALLDGVEWNVRLSKQQTGPLLKKFHATFETYWADPSYRPYDPARDAERVDEALRLASGGSVRTDEFTQVAGLDVRPYPHQEQILEKLRVEREVFDRHRNLVVAATGTGKTVLAALDYSDGVAPQGAQKSLLFVAHRRELLVQARRTFRAVLKDGSFGELFCAGERPVRWCHVFATVQSLGGVLDQLDPHQFDMVIIDEFHHAEAASYKRVMARFEPGEFLGLTATPERSDGLDVRQYCGGRYAAEIRLWDALKADLLTPFHYFAIADNTDLSHLEWRRGAYQTADLEKLYVGDDARVALVLKQLADKILEPRRMKALGFCVSVAHAEYMADAFNRAGLPSLAVTGHSEGETRKRALQLLDAGEICTVFTVDLFNEGIDLPSIDTVMFLRPTESATIFLQQLGRGLRKAKDKAVLTALDFVGLQHKDFRFDVKYRALSGSTRQALTRQVSEGFSQLPPGTEIIFDEASQAQVLAHLKNQLKPKWRQVVQEMTSSDERTDRTTLFDFLAETGWSLPDVVRDRSRNWTSLRESAGLTVPQQGPRHAEIIARGRAFAHVDDPLRLAAYRRILCGEVRDLGDLADSERIIASMLLFSVWPNGGGMNTEQEMLDALRAEPAACAEFLEILAVAEDRIAHVSRPMIGRLAELPLRMHAHYSREEIAVGMRYASMNRTPTSLTVGVFYSEVERADTFLVTVKKNERNYSPTTMYNDHAVSQSVFHWESQSTTSVDSPVGRRYITHQENDSEIVLFVRPEKNGEFGSAAPFMCLGTADYVRHSGSRPIEFDWRLRAPMPADMYVAASLE